MHYNGVSSVCEHHDCQSSGMRSGCLLKVSRLSLGSLDILTLDLLLVLSNVHLVLGVVFPLESSGCFQLKA